MHLTRDFLTCYSCSYYSSMFIPDSPHRMLITGSSGSGETNALVNLMKEQENYKLIDCLWRHDCLKFRKHFLDSL